MNIVKIQYTVSGEFTETNKKNVAKVMEDLRAANHPEIRYSTYLFEDGKTFMHLFVAPDKNAMTVINGLESFKQFQMALMGSKPEVPPQFQNLTLVGSSYDILG